MTSNLFGNTKPSKLGNLFGSRNFSESSYESLIIVTKHNKIKLIIKVKESNLSFYCYFFRDFIKTSFENKFSLDELKKKCLFFNQFTDINEVFKELYFNEKKGQEYIIGNENLDDKIIVAIPIVVVKFPTLQFELNRVTKTEKELMGEYKKAINIYKFKINISNFNSQILEIYPEKREELKAWISPSKKIKAELLYSYYVNCKKKSEGEYEIDSKDRNKIGNIEAFHMVCDNKSNILIICRSNDEIIGGYTPLFFTNTNDYGYDNKSFLFSLNKMEKYPKSSYDNTESIWCYKDYGPCFGWDLYFRKYKMDVLKFEKDKYLTPNNWIDTKKCYNCSEGVLLDSLEIFQIIFESNNNEENEFVII